MLLSGGETVEPRFNGRTQGNGADPGWNGGPGLLGGLLLGDKTEHATTAPSWGASPAHDTRLGSSKTVQMAGKL